MRTTHAKTHNQYNLELLEVLACRKENEYQRFKDVGNRMLLWHGSRMSNWAGILSQGLRIAPPEAPVTGYMVSEETVWGVLFHYIMCAELILLLLVYFQGFRESNFLHSLDSDDLK